MVQQVTKGIKISISTRFEGTHFENKTMYFVFSYTIQIENQSNDTVQLLSRHWDIYDSLNSKEVVEGEGVVGQKPILSPKQVHNYTSNCFLTSPIGSMTGYYNMINFATTKRFRVHIPTFQLMASAILN
jgi:ApaG protein